MNRRIVDLLKAGHLEAAHSRLQELGKLCSSKPLDLDLCTQYVNLCCMFQEYSELRARRVSVSLTVNA